MAFDPNDLLKDAAIHNFSILHPENQMKFVRQMREVFLKWRRDEMLPLYDDIGATKLHADLTLGVFMEGFFLDTLSQTAERRQRAMDDPAVRKEAMQEYSKVILAVLAGLIEDYPTTEKGSKK